MDQQFDIMARDNQPPDLNENNESDPVSWALIGIGITLVYLVLSIASGGIVYAAFSPKLEKTNSTLFTKLSDFIDLGTSYVLNKTKTKPNQPAPVLNINWTMQLYENTNWTCPDNKGSCLMTTLNVSKCITINPDRPLLQANQTCIPQPKPPCIPQLWPNVTSCRPVIRANHPGRREKCCSDESCYKPSKPGDSKVETCEYPICPKVESTKFTIEDFRNSPFLDAHSWFYWLNLFKKYSPERLEVVTTLMERTVEELNRATMSHRCKTYHYGGYKYAQESCQICKNRYDYIECVMNNELENPVVPELKVELFSLDELKRLERSVVKVVYGFDTKDIDEMNPFYERFERLQNASKVKTKDGKNMHSM